MQLTLIAVPTFYLISLYLFYSHISSTGSGYLWRRLRRIVKLFIFWTAIQVAVYFIVRAFGHYYPNVWLGFRQICVAQAFVMGGPSLPYVGDSVFYFLFDLAILTVLAFSYARINDRIRIPLGLAVILGSAIYFEICHVHNISVPYWRPDSFIIYIPIAYMLTHSDSIKSFWFFFLAGFIFFIAHNIWFLKSDPSAYARISIVLGTVAVFCIFQSLNLGLTDRFTQFLGRYSLGIFAIHKYWQLFFICFFTKAFSVLEIGQSVTISNIRFSLIYFVIGVFAIVFSLVIVRILGKTRLREYVS